MKKVEVISGDGRGSRRSEYIKASSLSEDKAIRSIILPNNNETTSLLKRLLTRPSEISESIIVSNLTRVESLFSKQDSTSQSYTLKSYMGRSLETVSSKGAPETRYTPKDTFNPESTNVFALDTEASAAREAQEKSTPPVR